MQEHCRNGDTTFSARNSVLFRAPCLSAFRQLEFSLFSCPRALDRTEEVWCPGEMPEPPGAPLVLPALCGAAGLAGLCWLLPEFQLPRLKEWNSAWVLCRIMNDSQIRRWFSSFYAQNSFVHTCICNRYIKNFFFFCVTWFELPVSTREKKNGRARKQERGRDAPSTKHVKFL